MHFLFISFPIEDAFGQSQIKLLLILAHFWGQFSSQSTAKKTSTYFHSNQRSV